MGVSGPTSGSGEAANMNGRTNKGRAEGAVTGESDRRRRRRTWSRRTVRAQVCPLVRLDGDFGGSHREGSNAEEE
jgi:hypothetical protein